MVLSQINELEHQIKNLDKGKELLLAYKNLMILYNNFEPEKTLEISEDAISIAEELQEKDLLYGIKGNVAIANIYLENYYEAFNILISCKHYYQQTKNEHLERTVLTNIANIYYYVNDIQTALYIWKDLIVKFKENKELEAYHILMVNILLYYISHYKSIEGISEDMILDSMTYYESKGEKKSFNYVYLLYGYTKYLGYENTQIEKYENNLFLALKYAEESEYHRILPGIYFDYAILLKKKNKEDLYHEYLLKALDIAESFNNLYSIDILYNELYQYYTNQKKYKQALEFHQKIYKFDLEKIEKEKNHLAFFEKNNFNITKQVREKIAEPIINKVLFNNERFIIEEDNQGRFIKINIDHIVSVKSKNNLALITLVGNKTIYTKKNFKQLYSHIISLFLDQHLFFLNNVRNEFINLYWISKYVPSSKKVFLFAIDKEYEYDVTLRQVPILKSLLASQ
jgi:tetratricopeptide (TPR) repeat protein